MDAVVDDLTNYLGPDPNATGDGGVTKVYQATARPDLDAQADPADGHDVRLRPAGSDGARARTSTPATTASTCSASPAPTTRASATSATPGIRSSTRASAAVGNRDGWNPIYRDERTYSLATNLTKVAGRHDIRGGYFLNFLYLDHWQPETGNPRGNFTFNAQHDRTARRPDDQLLQPVRVVPARPGRHRQQERAERADDVARVAARALHPRPLERELPTDPGPRPALGVLPDHARAPMAAASIGSI